MHMQHPKLRSKALSSFTLTYLLVVNALFGGGATASVFIEGNFSVCAIERVQLESDPTGPAPRTLYLTAQHNSYC